MAAPYRDATEYVPKEITLQRLRSAIQSCRGCDLYQHATQAVLGEIQGHQRRARAAMMMIGEQPGDKEDLAGRPFIGPAGRLLNSCLIDAGIDRNQVYVTNAVKHFKWTPRGKIRLHKKPSLGEVRACRPWLDAELEVVRPKIIVCLGAVSARDLLGSRFRLIRDRGILQRLNGYPPILVTAHPASVLRAHSDIDRRDQTARLVSDLRRVLDFLRDNSVE